MTQLNRAARPIPGTAMPGDLKDPVQALVQFYRAFNDRNLAMMENSWEHSEDVVGISPLGDIVQGWSDIRKGYEHLFSSPMRITTEFYDYAIHRSGDVCFVIGRERGHVSVGDKIVQPMPMARATNIFRRGTDGTWKLVHHHISVPSPMASAEYQPVEHTSTTHSNSEGN